MNDRPTPETNSAFKFWPCEQMELVDAEFARRLERERNEAREQERIHYDNFVALQREVRGEI